MSKIKKKKKKKHCSNEAIFFYSGENGIHLDAVQNNLVDVVWNEASKRPSFSSRPAFVHDLAYAGTALIISFFRPLYKYLH